MPSLSEAILATFEQKNCQVEWSKRIKKINSSKSDGHRFIGDWDDLKKDIRVAVPGNHVAVIFCRKEWKKMAWKNFPGSPRKGWQETQETLPPNENPQAETGTEKWEAVGDKVAVAYRISISKDNPPVIQILASVPWDGINWGIELQDKAKWRVKGADKPC